MSVPLRSHHTITTTFYFKFYASFISIHNRMSREGPRALLFYNCLSRNHHTFEKCLTLLDNGLIFVPNVELTCDLLSNATHLDCQIPI